jgi:hypothetical protein
MSIKNYQLSDFISEVQTRLREPATGGLWSTADLTIYINRALLKVYMDTRTVKRDTQIPIVKGFCFYSLPSDYMIPEFLYCSSTYGNARIYPTKIFAMDKKQQGRAPWEKDFPGQPTRLVPFSFGQFILWPPPDATDVTTLHYIPFPEQLVNSSDLTLLPLNAQRLVPIYASFLAQMKNDPKRAIKVHLAEYKQRMPAIVAQQRHNEQLRPQMLVPAQAFDRKHANPDVVRDWTTFGYR